MLYTYSIKDTLEGVLEFDRRVSGNRIIDPTMQPANAKHCYQYFISYVVGQRSLNVGLVVRNLKTLP